MLASDSSQHAFVQPEGTDSVRLRVMTANLYNGNGEPAALERVLSERDPDVVLAQELSPEQAEVLRAHYPHLDLNPRRDTRGMGIASRFAARFSEIPMPCRSARVAMIEAADCPALKHTRSQRLEIINVHFSPPHKPRRMAERVRQVPTLCRYLSQVPQPRRLVAGDLNTFDPMPAYFQLRRHLDDAIADCANANGRKLAPTWGLQPAGLRMLRIDHMFSRGLRAQHYEVVRISGSDHNALIADLQLDAAQ